MNSIDQSEYRFLNLSSILPAIPPDICNSHFNLRLSYCCSIAIPDTQYQIPDPWVAAVAIAECYRDRNSRPIVSHHFPIAKSDELNMEAIALLSRWPVWSGSHCAKGQGQLTKLTNFIFYCRGPYSLQGDALVPSCASAIGKCHVWFFFASRLSNRDQRFC